MLDGQNFFSKSPITIGNGNIVKNIDYSNGFIDWDKLKDELFDIIKVLPNNSVEEKISKQAIEYALEKNENKMIAFIKEHSKEFTSKVFTSAAGGVLAQIIKNALSL